MDKIDLKKIYHNIEKQTNSEQANKFIYTLNSELISFQSRIKNIIETILIKYKNKISNSTLEKFRNQSFNIKSNEKHDNDESIDNFLSNLTNKLDKVYFEEKNNEIYSKNINSYKNNEINIKPIENDIIENDILWIPNEDKENLENNILDDGFNKLQNKKEEKENSFDLEMKEMSDEDFLLGIRSKI